MRPWSGALILAVLILGVLALVFRNANSSRHALPATGGNEPALSPSDLSAPPADREVEGLEREEPTRRTPLDVVGEPATDAPVEYVFHGRVIDAGTGSPLAASIEARTAYGGTPTRTKANTGGLFRLALDAERAGVLVRHAEFAAAMIEVSEENASPENAAVVELSLSARLLVQVRGRGAGRRQPLELRLQADPLAMRGEGQPFWWYSSWLDPTWSGAVDGSGKLVLAGLPPNVPLHVDVNAAKERIYRLPEPILLASGEERELVIDLDAGCRITGIASETDGTTAAGLPVWMSPADAATFVKYFAAEDRRDVRERAVTDAAGRFAFEHVPAGEWWIGPAPGQRGTGEPVSAEDPAPLAQRVVIAAGQKRVEVRLDVHRGLSIEGEVVGWQGERVSRARVWCRRAGLLVEARDGRFQLGPLAPGEYELVGSSFEGANSEPVRALAGAGEVVLRLRRGGAITGSVYWPDGRRIPAVVELVPADPEAAGFTRRKVEEHGFFAFRGLVPGIYHLCAHDEEGNVGRSEAIVVEAGVEIDELSVELAPGATITARLPERESGPFLGFRVVQSGVEAGIAFPPTRSLPVLPGPVTVELVAYDLPTDTLNALDAVEVEAVAGEEIEVDFAARQGR